MAYSTYRQDVCLIYDEETTLKYAHFLFLRDVHIDQLGWGFTTHA